MDEYKKSSNKLSISISLNQFFYILVQIFLWNSSKRKVVFRVHLCNANGTSLLVRIFGEKLFVSNNVNLGDIYKNVQNKKISTKLKIFEFFNCVTNSNTDSSSNVWKYMKAHKTFTISKLGSCSLLNLSVYSSASGACYPLLNLNLFEFSSVSIS